MKLFELESFSDFQLKAEEIKNNLLNFLIDSKRKGKKLLHMVPLLKCLSKFCRDKK